MTTLPRRLGMLAPSSNTVLEPATWKLLPADGSVTAHVSRLRVVQISGDQDSLGQFALDRVIDAASLLADAAVDLILWNEPPQAGSASTATATATATGPSWPPWSSGPASGPRPR